MTEENKTPQKGKKISGKGITTIIDPSPDADIQYDSDGRFYSITHKLADSIISQTNIPLCILHQADHKIGHVTHFYKGKVKEQNVLFADFEITSQSFINALMNQAILRFQKIQPVPFTSPDQFVPEIYSVKNAEHEPIELDAQLALTQKFPGLSLSHEQNTERVRELSICLAGARELSVITNINYIHDAEIIDEDNTDEKNYLLIFAAALAHSNSSSTEKVAKDFEQIIGNTKRPDCLVYNHMNCINQVKDKGKDNTMNMDDNCQSTTELILEKLTALQQAVNMNKKYPSTRKRKMVDEYEFENNNADEDVYRPTYSKRSKLIDHYSNRFPIDQEYHQPIFLPPQQRYYHQPYHGAMYQPLYPPYPYTHEHEKSQNIESKGKEEKNNKNKEDKTNGQITINITPQAGWIPSLSDEKKSIPKKKKQKEHNETKEKTSLEEEEEEEEEPRTVDFSNKKHNYSLRSNDTKNTLDYIRIAGKEMDMDME